MSTIHNPTLHMCHLDYSLITWDHLNQNYKNVEIYPHNMTANQNSNLLICLHIYSLIIIVTVVPYLEYV